MTTAGPAVSSPRPGERKEPRADDPAEPDRGQLPQPDAALQGPVGRVRSAAGRTPDGARSEAPSRASPSPLPARARKPRPATGLARLRAGVRVRRMSQLSDLGPVTGVFRRKPIDDTRTAAWNGSGLWQLTAIGIGGDHRRRHLRAGRRGGERDAGPAVLHLVPDRRRGQRRGRAVLRRVRRDDPEGRLGLHLRLRGAGRVRGLVHRLGPAARVHRDRGGRRDRHLRLLRVPARRLGVDLPAWMLGAPGTGDGHGSTCSRCCSAC